MEELKVDKFKKRKKTYRKVDKLKSWKVEGRKVEKLKKLKIGNVQSYKHRKVKRYTSIYVGRKGGKGEKYNIRTKTPSLQL